MNIIETTVSVGIDDDSYDHKTKNIELSYKGRTLISFGPDFNGWYWKDTIGSSQPDGLYYDSNAAAAANEIRKSGSISVAKDNLAAKIKEQEEEALNFGWDDYATTNMRLLKSTIAEIENFS
jgi:hypothetical protein